MHWTVIFIELRIVPLNISFLYAGHQFLALYRGEISLRAIEFDPLEHSMTSDAAQLSIQALRRIAHHLHLIDRHRPQQYHEEDRRRPS